MTSSDLPTDEHSSVRTEDVKFSTSNEGRPNSSLGSNDRQLLSQIDWSFNDRKKASKIESIHPYPAKFIGAIPAAFLKTLQVPTHTAVFDPFCGSGTTLVEAQRAGYPTIGIDLNPIACLISRVKTSPVAPGFLDAAMQLVKDEKDSSSKIRTPDIPNIDHWFQEEIQTAIAGLSKAIVSPAYNEWQDQLRLTLSSILVRVSNQDSDTRYAAVDKGLKYEDVFANFNASAKKLDDALNSRDWLLTPSQVIEANVLDVKSKQIQKPIGLVITSPPYPNAYEYWLYHKYRMWWLGFDPLAVKEKEIGARAHFFKKNHHTAKMFEDQMRQTLNLINEVLVPGGYVCIVVGRSKIHGVIIDNGSMIYELAQQLGLQAICKFERPINPNRKSFNLSHANIKSESILVLKKPIR